MQNIDIDPRICSASGPGPWGDHTRSTLTGSCWSGPAAPRTLPSGPPLGAVCVEHPANASFRF